MCVDAINSLSTLLLKSGYVEAGHTCNILFNSATFGPPMEHKASLKLLGSDSGNDIDSILMSMVYEFFQSSTEPQTPGYFTHLLPYKLNYASYLADYGKITEARSLYDLITGVIKASPKSSSITPTFVSQVDSLGYRLNMMPEEAGTGWFSGKLARPKLDQVLGQLDKSLSKFIAGEEGPVEQKKDPDGGIFKRLAETPSTSNSYADIRAKYSSFNSDMDLPPSIVPSRTHSTIGFHFENNLQPPPPIRAGSMAPLGNSDFNRPNSPHYPSFHTDDPYRPKSAGPNNTRSRRSSTATRTSVGTPERISSPSLQQSLSETRSTSIYGIPENQALRSLPPSPKRGKQFQPQQPSPPKGQKPAPTMAPANPYAPPVSSSVYGSAVNLRKNIYNPYAPKEPDAQQSVPKPVSQTSPPSQYNPYLPEDASAKKGSISQSPKGSISIGQIPPPSVTLSPSSSLPSSTNLNKPDLSTPEKHAAGSHSRVYSPAPLGSNNVSRVGSPVAKVSAASRVSSPVISSAYSLDGPYSGSIDAAISAPPLSNPYPPSSNPSTGTNTSGYTPASTSPNNSYAPSRSGVVSPHPPAIDDYPEIPSSHHKPDNTSRYSVESLSPKHVKSIDSSSSSAKDNDEDFDKKNNNYNDDEELPLPPVQKAKPSVNSVPNPYAPTAQKSSGPASVSNPYTPSSGGSYNPYAPNPTSSAPSKTSYNPYAPPSGSSKPISSPSAELNNASSAPLPIYGGYDPFSYSDTQEVAKDNEDKSEETKFNTEKDEENNDNEGSKNGDQVNDDDFYAPYEQPQYGFNSYDPEDDVENDVKPDDESKGSDPESGAAGNFFVPLGAPSFAPSVYSQAVPLAQASSSNLAQNHNYNNSNEEEDDDIEDLGIGNQSKKPEPKASTDSKNDESSSSKKDDDSKDQNKKGWFGWLSRKHDDQPKAIKAKLGEESSFYYDKDLKRWINKNAPKEEQLQQSAPPPPPPSGAASAPMSSIPSAGPPSAGPPGSGGPPGLAVPPSMGGPPGTSPIPSARSTPAPMPTSGGIDDLLAAVPTSGTARKGRRGARNRYVDIMNQ